MQNLLLIFIFLFWSCEDNVTNDQNPNLLFISSEGTFGNSDASISVFKNNELIQIVTNVGDVLQSLLVQDNKLYAIINNSHSIKRFNITENGLDLPGIEITTNNSSPREMVIVENKLYFTNWNTNDVKVLDLNTFSIISSITLNGAPEDIVTDGNFLWVSIPMLELYDKNDGSSIVKIDIDSENIIKTYEVGNGPEHMILNNNLLYISRTFYSADWSAFYGSSSLDTETGEISSIVYGAGIVCGGSLVKLNNEIMRTVDGGIAPFESDLNLNLARKIGFHSNLYSAFSDNEYLYLGISDYTAPDSVFIHNQSGDILDILSVGANPGDYAIWIND